MLAARGEVIAMRPLLLHASSKAKFDRFIQCYNQERPHQALNMKYPAELYRAFTAAVSRAT